MQDRDDHKAAAYAAVVFNDTTVLDIAAAARQAVPGLAGGSLFSSAAAAAVLSRALPGVPALPGAGALLGLTPEGRVIQRMVARFSSDPPVTLMHNMSAYHVLPALTGEQPLSRGLKLASEDPSVGTQASEAGCR